MVFSIRSDANSHRYFDRGHENTTCRMLFSSHFRRERIKSKRESKLTKCPPSVPEILMKDEHGHESWSWSKVMVCDLWAWS